MEHHLIVQEYDYYQERWEFSLTPEIGALFRFGNFSSWGAVVAVNYKWTTNRVTLLGTKSGHLSTMGLKLGLTYIVN